MNDTHDLVTIGETMAVFNPTSVGVLRHASSMTLGVAGAESNVAIGLRRLGARTAWTGRVGDDELGQLVLNRLRSEDVDISGAVVDAGAPTGVMVKERRTADVTRVSYYRTGSAGSRLCVDDLDQETVTGARILHVTGITPALSATAAEAVDTAMDMARDAATLVSLDLNYRSALWRPEQATVALRKLVSRADLVFAGDEEAHLVVDPGTPDDVVQALAALGPRVAVLKQGARGATVVSDGALLHRDAVPVRSVDPVGAGDAFVAGYLAGVLDGSSPEECLRLGTLVGAFAVTVPGDWEGLPTRAELSLLEQSDGTVLR